MTNDDGTPVIDKNQNDNTTGAEKPARKRAKKGVSSVHDARQRNTAIASAANLEPGRQNMQVYAASDDVSWPLMFVVI